MKRFVYKNYQYNGWMGVPNVTEQPLGAKTSNEKGKER
jgi:hypothetical protein